MRKAELALAEKIRDFLMEVGRYDRILADRVALNTTDLLCLGYVQGSAGPVTPKLLAEFVGISTGATTALIDRLERRGLLKREPHPTDRRGAILRIGDSAESAGVADLRQQFRDLMSEAWKSMSDEEIATVQRFFEITSRAVSGNRSKQPQPIAD